MSDFKAKMCQLRFRLGLCPRPRWERLQHSPRHPSWWRRGLAAPLPKNLTPYSRPFGPWPRCSHAFFSPTLTCLSMLQTASTSDTHALRKITFHQLKHPSLYREWSLTRFVCLWLQVLVPDFGAIEILLLVIVLILESAIIIASAQWH